METNDLFQNQANQNYGNQNYGSMNWAGQNNMGTNQQQYYGNFVNRTYSHNTNNIPVRVVFSPEQIAPQEIPTNGTPALFPLSDGSCIIVKSLQPNGMFDERVYALVPRNQNNQQAQASEFDQVMSRLGNIEKSLNTVLGDLYGNEPKGNFNQMDQVQDMEVNKNE